MTNKAKLMEKVERVRNAMDYASTAMTDEQALNAVALYPKWSPDTAYYLGDRVRDGDALYKCIQAHTAQTDWSPSATPALWVGVAPEGEAREIKDGMLATEAFAKGEVGWYGTKTDRYESLIDGNVWTPAAYPGGWKKL